MNKIIKQKKKKRIQLILFHLVVCDVFCWTIVVVVQDLTFIFLFKENICFIVILFERQYVWNVLPMAFDFEKKNKKKIIDHHKGIKFYFLFWHGQTVNFRNDSNWICLWLFYFFFYSPKCYLYIWKDTNKEKEIPSLENRFSYV